MPLGTQIRIDVYTKEGKYLRAIRRCLRPHGNLWKVFYETHTYVVKQDGRELSGYNIKIPYIEV